MTASAFGREELVEVLGASPERVKVVPLGVDERFRPDADPEPARRAHGLERPYVLAVGTRVARKNLDVLREAEARLAHARRGAGGGGQRARLHARGGRARRAGALGYVAEEHLPGLYAGARAVVVPSLYEGFGLPCLEAMAAGHPGGGLLGHRAARRPVATRRCWSTRATRQGFAGALAGLVEDEELHARLRAAGAERAADFSWERTAAELDAGVDGAAERRTF